MTRKKGTSKTAPSGEVAGTAQVAACPPPSLDEAARLADGDLVYGTVIRTAGGLYEVDVQFAGAGLAARNTNAAAPANETIVCSLRGTLKRGKRETAQPVSVGDSVLVRILPKTGVDARGRRLREGFVLQVMPRRSTLARARANKTGQVTMANLDQVLIVMAMREPEFNSHRLDRFLVLAEASELDVVICLNKIDLLKKRERRSEITPIEKLYRGLGYTVIAVSAETDENIDSLRACLRHKITAVLGSSGVGKSSLINAVQPGLHLWVGDVMEIGKGRHTTTEVSLHPLAGGGYLADTPGIKTVTLFERADLNLALCFPEFAEFSSACRFNNCRHDTEPDCAVRAAAASGAVAAGRHQSYLKILRDEKLVE
jgi:ribosome biogenesis GTPase